VCVFQSAFDLFPLSSLSVVCLCVFLPFDSDYSRCV
jgi:hypothetical protein